MFLALALAETGGDRARMAAVLSGLRAYQEHPTARTRRAHRVVAEAGRCRLVDHGGAGPPVVLVPSLVNAADVFDLAPGASLVESLSAVGLHPLVVEWGAPGPEERALDIDGLVTARLLPLIATLGEPVHLVGYCLGGTIAIAAAAIVPPRSLALVAAPWHFSRYPAARRAALGALWAEIAPAARATGVVPVDLLQPGFWELDRARSVAKFERFGALDPGSAEATRYVLVEDWVNGGPPIGHAAAAHIFERFYRDDEPGRGLWAIDGRAIDPAALSCPLLNIIARRDLIVPAAAAPRAGEQLALELGHVGMMVGGRAFALLHAPLARWLLAHE